MKPKEGHRRLVNNSVKIDINDFPDLMQQPSGLPAKLSAMAELHKMESRPRDAIPPALRILRAVVPALCPAYIRRIDVLTHPRSEESLNTHR